jgi:uncharacterized membrane protein
MSHIENIKRLFGDFKALNDYHSRAHQSLDVLQVEISKYLDTDIQVIGAQEKLTFLKGKSAVFFREFEKLRGELNSYKNTVNPDSSVVLAFDNKLGFIREKQGNFNVEIEGLKTVVRGFGGAADKSMGASGHHPSQSGEASRFEAPAVEPPQAQQGYQHFQQQRAHTPPKPKEKTKPKVQGMDDAEVFVGQKLFSYIGIGILVIGLGLGIKVAIDRDWFGELFQVILGYSVAAAIAAVGLLLKKKYEGLSVVLIGGALATAYFMTYSSYAFYHYFDQITAFAVMVILTAITVFAALKYDQELIAILGMVGAYAVPFLLDEDSGKVHVMFTFMAIINAGILFIAFKKYWRGLYYSSFGLTWVIFGSWFLFEYNAQEHFHIAVAFLSIFYVTFYSAFLSHKLIQKEDFNGGDIALVSVNSILFFIIGYTILDSTDQGQEFQGLFAIANAIFHFLITIVFYAKKMAEKQLFYIEAGMVLLFVTIAIPIQFDGEWIPIFWTLEGLILFFLGRIQGIKVYEILSYPMIILAFFSVCKSLISDYQPYLKKFSAEAVQLDFVMNEVFLGAALACIGFGILAILNRVKSKRPKKPNGWQMAMDYFFPIMTFALIYFTFFAEISAYWTQEFNRSINYDILKFRTISIMDYSLMFIGALAGLNWIVWKNKNFGIILTSVSMFGILLYALLGSFVFNDLSDSLQGANEWSKYYQLSAMKVYLYKYLSLVVFVLFTLVQFSAAKALKLGETFVQWNAGLIHLCALIVISHEFLFIADTNGFSNSTKTALSVMWAAYAVVLMAIGISKQRGYLRISAFVIWGVVLTKLLLYDLTNLSMEVKTLVFISIGVLLLIVSYLYYRVVAKQKQEAKSVDDGKGKQETGYQEP